MLRCQNISVTEDKFMFSVSFIHVFSTVDCSIKETSGLGRTTWQKRFVENDFTQAEMTSSKMNVQMF